MWTFSPDNVSVTIAGVLTLDGFVTGEFIRITKDNPLYTLRRVASGGIARRKIVSDSYTISLTVMSGSKTNDILDKLHKLDVLSDKAKVPLLIKDRTGSSYFFTSLAWVESVPDKTYSTDESSMTWVLRCADGVNNVGGNETLNDIETQLSFLASSIPYISELLESIR